MKVIVFLVIYVVLIVLVGAIAVAAVGSEFIVPYSIAAALGAIGGAYTVHTHMKDES